jgi:hypothetical protein
MDTREKSLYQQIHPAKLLTDFGAGFVSLHLLWQHYLVFGLAVAFIPSIATTIVAMRYANLERLKRSGFGNYVAKYMTPTMQALRLGGNFIMLFGAWYNVVWVILVGLVVILPAWLRGVIFR